MFDDIFYSLCLGCGERTRAGDALCTGCREKLPRFAGRCGSCGWTLPVDAATCGRCGTFPFDRLYTQYRYTGAMRELLKAVKFRYHYACIREIASLVDATEIAERGYDAIVPVPSHLTRRFQRLRHPADVIAQELAGKTGIPLLPKLIRVRKTAYQYSLGRAARFENIKGAFDVRAGVDVSRILLVDDILTTGATMSECAKRLKRSGVTAVDCYTLCKGA